MVALSIGGAAGFVFGMRNQKQAAESPGRLPENSFQAFHDPNPTDQYRSDALKEPPYEHMWFYQTVVRNNSDRKLKVVWFEAYFKDGDQWVASNVLNRPLTNAIFRQWFSDGKEGLDADGWIVPHGEALNAVNWHYNTEKTAPDSKWCFIAVDEYGFDYFAEAVIQSIPQP